MIAVRLQDLVLLEGWQEHDPALRNKVAFPLYAVTGTSQSSTVYFELEPGKALGTHTDSAEEILLVLGGTVEVTVGAETVTASQGTLALVPAMVPHGVRNVGAETARCLGFFAAPRVVSTFTRPIMPLGQQEAGMPPIPAPDGPLTWNQVAERLMAMFGGNDQRP